MKDFIFVLVSGLYIISLAVTDGAFNRLVFRENRKLSYFSAEKKSIYKMWEWKLIGVIPLTVLPIIIPFLVSFALGGFKYILLYLLVLLIVSWDMIFGKLVFDDWFGDTPSIALPKIGWVHVSLLKNLILRLVLFILVLIIIILKY